MHFLPISAPVISSSPSFIEEAVIKEKEAMKGIELENGVKDDHEVVIVKLSKQEDEKEEAMKGEEVSIKEATTKGINEEGAKEEATKGVELENGIKDAVVIVNLPKQEGAKEETMKGEEVIKEATAEGVELENGIKDVVVIVNLSKQEGVGEEAAKDCGGGDNDTINDNDDDGYHTPTSPRHRIPPITECPPAPIKLSTQHSNIKRRRRRSTRSKPDLAKDLSLIFSEINDLFASQMRKKARSEAAAANIGH